MNNPTINSVCRQGNIARQVRHKGKLVLIVIASSLILAPAAQAFEFKTSGQVSRMVVAPDDAVGDEIQHQDIGFSGSRFRFTGSETMDNGMTVGFRYEIQARRGAAGGDGAELTDGGDNQENRLQDVYFKGGFGSIALGRGDGAGNGATEVDMSGTVLASPSTLDSNWGGYKITPDLDGTADDDSIAWNTVYKMFDANSRQNRVRYDSPSFNGFSFAVSANQGNANELAVRYKGTLFGHKFGAAYYTGSTADSKDDTDDVGGNCDTTPTCVPVDGADISGGSASLLLNNGLNFTVAISESDITGGTRDATFFKVGYKKGKHAFAVDQADGENDAAVTEGDSTGFTYAYFPHKGVELFATVRTLDSTGVVDSTGGGAQSVDLTAIGTRLKF